MCSLTRIELSAQGFKFPIELNSCVNLTHICIAGYNNYLDLTFCDKLTFLELPGYNRLLDLTQCTYLNHINLPDYNCPLNLTQCKLLTHLNLPVYDLVLDLSQCVYLTYINIPNYKHSLENISHLKKILHLNVDSCNETINLVTLDKYVSKSLVQETVAKLQTQIDELKKENETIKLQIKESHKNDIITYYC